MGCLERLRGMFAFALLDTNTRQPCCAIGTTLNRSLTKCRVRESVSHPISELSVHF